jgi:hypothetical protein
MRWFWVLSLSAVLSAGGVNSVQRDEAAWKTYRNGKYGYELSYPPGMEYKEYVGGSSGDLKDAGTGETLIRFEVWPPGVCPRQPDNTTAKEIGIERAKTITQADGPDSSSYCGDPMKVQEFVSSHDVKFFELELTCMREIFSVWDEEDAGQAAPAIEAQSEIFIEGKKGPTYFADISQSWRKRILLADPINSRRFSQAPVKSRIDLGILRKILETLKKFPVPKPPGVCIEDLIGEIRG